MFKFNAKIKVSDIEKLMKIDSSMLILDIVEDTINVGFKVSFKGSLDKLLEVLKSEFRSFDCITVSI